MIDSSFFFRNGFSRCSIDKVHHSHGNFFFWNQLPSLGWRIEKMKAVKTERGIMYIVPAKNCWTEYFNHSVILGRYEMKVAPPSSSKNNFLALLSHVMYHHRHATIKRHPTNSYDDKKGRHTLTNSTNSTPTSKQPHIPPPQW